MFERAGITGIIGASTLWWILFMAAPCSAELLPNEQVANVGQQEARLQTRPTSDLSTLNSVPREGSNSNAKTTATALTQTGKALEKCTLKVALFPFKSTKRYFNSRREYFKQAAMIRQIEAQHLQSLAETNPDAYTALMYSRQLQYEQQRQWSEDFSRRLGGIARSASQAITGY